MKKIVFVLIALSMIAAVAFGQVRFVGGKFVIEKGAKVRVGVDNDKWGQAIVETWNEENPDQVGLVEYMNFGAAGGTDAITQLQNETADICMVIDGEVARNQQSLMVLDTNLVKLATDVTQLTFLKAANPTDYKFIPIAYDGMTFAWNETMMKKLGLDITDKTPKDGLPDAFDTWEEIFALSKKWAAGPRPVYNKATVNVVFPMSLEEVWSGYSSLTAGGWEIFAERDATKPGFEKSSFAQGLEFIKAASEAMISVEANGAKTPAASMIWRWDDFLNNQISPFGLVGTWQDVATAEKKGGYNIRFSALPTWKGKNLTPFVKSKGFVINGFTKYPGAASEVLRQLYSKAFLTAMVNNSSYIPALGKTEAAKKVTPSFRTDPNKAEMMVGFAFNYPEPSATLPANKAKKGMDVYYNIGLNLIFRSVWDGEKSPADAQKEAVELAAKWLADNNK